MIPTSSTCLATIQTKGATTSRAEAERATNKRLDKCFKDVKPTNHLSTKPTSNLLIQTNSNQTLPTPTNNPEEASKRSSTTRNVRAAAKQMIKAHAATTNGKLKTSTRSTTNAKGCSQVQGLHYFENYAPVASFITLRLLFALTNIPNFQVLQYDVSVAFIQSKLDSNHPPVYCECAKGYEDRRKYVYRLHRHLYGMKDSPRG